MNNEIRYRTMSLAESKRWANGIDQFGDDEFELLVNNWTNHSVDIQDASYDELRKVLVEAFDRAGGKTLPSRKMYPVDVEVGLDLYEYLSARGFTEAEAADDDVWRFISINVVPDLTYLRYPDPEKAVVEAGGRINRKRFFLAKRRIWISTLWWYVHLSWQGSKETTRKVIEGNGSNIISHFIETPGRGYRTSLYRALMKRYSSTSGKNDDLFRSIAKLNGAECRNIEPDLLPGGVMEYCERLLMKLQNNKDNE
ncbi:DUF6339 family protein [Raoultibacter timonensis]|uniref:DUF6339 family protein n=1 Tax=Raoultibacter timonensis TaxID=1907662 RepID=UPI0026DC8428|nr:DUF6339 family protein [Raoultibacter timonensis]